MVLVYRSRVRYWCTGAEYGIGVLEPSTVLVNRSRVRYWSIGVPEPVYGIGPSQQSPVIWGTYLLVRLLRPGPVIICNIFPEYGNCMGILFSPSTVICAAAACL
jgi:hypothetical protein